MKKRAMISFTLAIVGLLIFAGSNFFMVKMTLMAKYGTFVTIGFWSGIVIFIMFLAYQRRFLSPNRKSGLWIGLEIVGFILAIYGIWTPGYDRLPIFILGTGLIATGVVNYPRKRLRV